MVLRIQYHHGVFEFASWQGSIRLPTPTQHRSHPVQVAVWRHQTLDELVHLLQFRTDDHPFRFCLREMELHLRVKFKVADETAPAYHNNTAKFIVGPVNDFGYSCIRQVRCKVNHAETESASSLNLAYRKYFRTLLES